MRALLRTLQACSTTALCSVMTVTAQACAPVATPVAPANAGGQPAIVGQGVVFQTSVVPQPDEDLAAACRYEITLTSRSRRVQGVWVIFERSRDTLRYYQDADVRAFARRHDLALLFPSHKTQPSETMDCPDQSPPVRSSWCRSTRDTWGGENWSVSTATIEPR